MLHSSNKISPSIMITPRLKRMIMSCMEDKLVVFDGVVGSGRTRLMKAQRSFLKTMNGHETTWISSAGISGDSPASNESIEDMLQAVLAQTAADRQHHVYISDIELLSTEDLAYLESFILLAGDNIHVVVSALSGTTSYFRHPELNAKSTEISYSDLALKEDEVRRIVKEYNSSLRNDYAARLYELTLGWPLFVEASLTKASTIQELNRLCYADSFLRDRIVDGILADLHPDELELLVGMCMLDEFDSDLVRRVAKCPFPDRAIMRLQTQNIFVTDKDVKANQGRGVRYRCHPFLVSSIRSYAYANVSSHDLKKKMIEIITCYEKDEEHLKAFQIAFASGMYDYAFRMLVKNTFAVLPHVDVETLRHLANSYNHEDREDEYLYYLIAAWTAFLSGEHRRARLLLGRAEYHRGDVASQFRTRALFMLAETIRIGCNVFQGEYEKAVSLGQDLIERMGGLQLFLRCTIMHSMAEAYLRLGKYSEAKDALLRASMDAYVSGRHAIELLCEADMAWLKFIKSDLDASSNVTLRALARAETENHYRGWPVGILYVSLARVHLQWCEVKKVHTYLDCAAELLSPDNNRDAFLELKVTLARLLELEGKHEESYEQIVMAHEMTLWDSVPRGIDLLVTVTLAEILVTRGRYDEAMLLIDGMLEKISPRDDFYCIHADIARARALVLGRAAVEEAAAILEKALKRANDTGQILLATYCKVKLACVYRIEGRAQDGVNLMTQALEECAEEGKIYTFTFPMPFQNALIYEIAFPTSDNLVIDSTRKRARDHARKIIGYLKEQDSLGYAAECGNGADGDRYAKLTPRERDVCELLKQGKTRQQIADELGLKLNTVRTHIRSAYKKLDIHERSML